MTAMFALKTAKNIYIIKAISSRWTLFIYADFYIHQILFFETKSHIIIVLFWIISHVVLDPTHIHPGPSDTPNTQKQLT